MKPSSEPCNKSSVSASNLDLDLPVDPGFISHLKPISPDNMMRHNQWLVEQFNSRPDAEARRLRDKCGVEFVL